MLYCEICGRSSDQYPIKRYKGKILCRKHISQQWRHGTLSESTIFDKNDIVLCEDHAFIILKDRDCQEVARAIIDLDNVERCHGVKWYARKKSNGIYAMGSMKGGKKVFLHRFIMDYYGKLDVDHINRNTLDNRKANLRIMEHYRNSANNASTGIKRTPAGRYQALICFRGKTIYLGTFDSAEEAAMVRREKKRELFNI